MTVHPIPCRNKADESQLHQRMMRLEKLIEEAPNASNPITLTYLVDYWTLRCAIAEYQLRKVRDRV